MASAALSRLRTFGPATSAEPATARGFVTKTLFSLGMLAVAAGVGYTRVDGDGRLLPGAAALTTVAVLVAFAVAVGTSFAPRIAKFTTLPYAALEGFAVGVVSRAYGSGRVIAVGHGSAAHVSTGPLVLEALVLTGAVIGIIGVAFAVGTRLSPRALHVVAVATGAVAVYYLIDLVAGFFGGQMPGLWSAGLGGIALSLFVVGLAAVNLLADFQYVESALQARAPKDAEWYGAFGIMVSIVWLYLEVLRLLAKTRR